MREFSIKNLKDWELEIVNKYPTLYFSLSPYVKQLIYSGRLIEEEAVNLRYGFECDSGWRNVIEDWSQSVIDFQGLVWRSGMDSDFKIYPCIIKEKFGTIRFQSDIVCSSNVVWSLWGKLEDHFYHKSENTCEKCGKFGRMSKDGWWKVLCTECGENKGNKKEEGGE